MTISKLLDWSSTEQTVISTKIGRYPAYDVILLLLYTCTLYCIVIILFRLCPNFVSIYIYIYLPSY